MQAINKVEDSVRDLGAVMSNIVLKGDISGLSPVEKITYYEQLCNAAGINPVFKPFDYVKFQGKEVLYANKNCSEQLRLRHQLSVTITAREEINGVYIVTARAMNKEGRCDESTGVVNAKGLVGEALANAMMKAETKAKRRVTLSFCGLGMLDETEIESIKSLEKAPIIDINEAYTRLREIANRGDLQGLQQAWESLTPQEKKALNPQKESLKELAKLPVPTVNNEHDAKDDYFYKDET